MKLQKKCIILAIVLLVLLLAGVVVFRNQQKTLTRYESAGGWVYECSQPIKAKNGTAQTLGHPQDLIPVDDSEASKYCHKVGIE